MAEVEAALHTGWKPNQIILNGPAKWWPRGMEHHQGLKAVYCDSREEFERLINSGRRDELWGLRLKIPGFSSRFGAELDSFEDIEAIVSLIKKMPRDIDLGFHIHLASNPPSTGRIPSPPRPTDQSRYWILAGATIRGILANLSGRKSFTSLKSRYPDCESW